MRCRYVAFGNAKNVTDNTTGEVTLRFQHGPGALCFNSPAAVLAAAAACHAPA